MPLDRLATAPSRNLAFLVAARTTSAIGDGMTIVAAPLLVAKVTGDELSIALAGFATYLPWLLLGLPAGVIADRVPRRQLMIVADGARVVVMLVLALIAGSDLLRLWPVYLLVFAKGSAQTLFDSALHAYVPDVVEPEQLERANGRLFAGQSIGLTLLGPPLGGLLFTWSPAAPFIIDAVSFAASGALLYLLRGRPKATPSPHAEPAAGVYREMWIAVRHIAHHRLLRTFAVLAATVSLAQGMVLGVQVLWATNQVRLDSVGFGLFIGVNCAGGVVGAMSAKWLAQILGAWWVLRGAALGASLAVLLYGLAERPWQAFIIAGFGGFVFMAWSVVATSVRQRTVPTNLLGRTAAAYRIVGVSALAVGTLVGGYTAGLFSLSAPFLIGGIFASTVVVFTAKGIAPCDDDNADALLDKRRSAIR